jgi:hypothetical protein
MSAPDMEAPTLAATEATHLLAHDNTNGGERDPAEESHPIHARIEQIEQETLRAIKGTLFCSWANLLLFCVPLGLVAGELGWDATWVFVLNFLAIFPLAEILSYSTEELSASVGNIFGGLINATFGNAVEMIVGCSPSSFLVVGLR